MKCVTKKLCVSILGLTAGLLINAESTNEWRESPSGFTYKSGLFSCEIDKSGTVHKLSTLKSEVLSRSLIHATPVKTGDEKVDLRIFQSKKCDSIKVKKDGEQKYSLVAKGILGNKKYKEQATYTEKITLTPEKISFDYEVVTKEPISMRSYNPFMSLQYGPCSVLKGLGYVTIDDKDKKNLCQFPTIYKKESRLHKGSINNLRIVLPDGHVVFNTAEDSTLSLSDSRSWGSDNFRIDVKPFIPYSAKPINYPVGSSFKWSFSISYEDK